MAQSDVSILVILIGLYRYVIVTRPLSAIHESFVFRRRNRCLRLDIILNSLNFNTQAKSAIQLRAYF